MSDMADFALDEVTELEHLRDLFHNGHLTGSESHDMGFLDSCGAYTGFGGDDSDYSELGTYESLSKEIAEGIQNFGNFSSAGFIRPERANTTNEASYYKMGKEEELRLFKSILEDKFCDKYIKLMQKELEEANFNAVDVSTKDNLSEFLSKLNTKYPKAYEALDYVLHVQYGSRLLGSFVFNEKAVTNAIKDKPTCNVCENEMEARNGKFGKFYFCSNHCEGQPTVSDKYWQEFKQKIG